MTAKARVQLEKLRGEPFSFASIVRAYRAREELTQEQLAKKLKVTKAYISNLENKRENVTVEQAKKFATILKEPVNFWVTTALQDMIDRAGIKARVELAA
jgi:transcriptional regulator with XRE-family HTH domain